MKLKEINRTAVQAWSPAPQHPVLLATGTSAQQLDASFSTSASLEIFQLDLADPALAMKSCGSFSSPHRYHKLVWAMSDSPSGLLIAGGENGNIILYDVSKLTSGDGDVMVCQSEKHSGPVRALDINPLQSNLVASGGNESEIYIWDLNSFSCPMTPGPKTQPLEDIRSVAWNKQVQHILASSSPSGKTSVWDLRKNELIIKVSDHSNRMLCSGLAWNPDVATQLVVSSEDDRMPVVQLWDLRFATSPLKVLENHTRGVLAIAWSVADPELLLSCGKDNRVLCWNPNTAEVLYELPTSAQWCFDIQWCPRVPALLSAAAFDGHISIYSIMGGSDQHSVSLQAEQLSSSFGNMDPFGSGKMLPPLELPHSVVQKSFTPLKKPPRWIRSPAGASFAFGGKLVTVDGTRLDAAGPVHVSQVVTETQILQRSDQLQAAVDAGSFLDYCRAKTSAAPNQAEKTIWSFLQVNFEEDARRRYLELLGFKKDELDLKISAALENPAEMSAEVEAVHLPAEEMQNAVNPVEMSAEEVEPVNLPAEEIEDAVNPAEVSAEEVEKPLVQAEMSAEELEPVDLTEMCSEELLIPAEIPSEVEELMIPAEMPSDVEELLIPAEMPSDVEELLIPAEIPSEVEELMIPAEMPSEVEELLIPAEMPSEVEELMIPAEMPSEVEELMMPAEKPSEVEELLIPAEMPSGVEKLLIPAEMPSKVEELLIPAEMPSEQKNRTVVLDAVKNPLCCATDMDPLISEALLTGDYTAAVRLCLHTERMADALILAVAGGPKLLAQTQRKYFSMSQSKVSKLISAVVLKDLTEVVETCDLQNWKEALAALLTYASPEDFPRFCRLLGFRLEKSPDAELRAQACLCYICAGAVEPLVACWAKAGELCSPLALQELVEKVVVLQKAQRQVSPGVDALLEEKMQQYAALLASQGSLHSAESFLPRGSQQVLVQQMRERLSRALDQTSSVQTNTTSVSRAEAPGSRPQVSSLTTAPHYYRQERSASTVTSWSNQTPTALPTLPPQVELQSAGRVSGPGAPYLYSQQYQNFQCPPGLYHPPSLPPVSSPPVMGPGSPSAPEAPAQLPASQRTGPQNGWNDPPSLHRAAKKKVPEHYSPPAPITAPIMAPLPEPLPEQPVAPSTEGPPGAPTGGSVKLLQTLPVETLKRKPIPEEHGPLRDAFEGLVQKCCAVASDPQTKRKLDEAHKKLELLYDKLREQTLSPSIISGLHDIARSIQRRSYSDALNIHTHIVSSSNFSETSTFMPVLKMLLTQANKLGV